MKKNSIDFILSYRIIKKVLYYTKQLINLFVFIFYKILKNRKFFFNGTKLFYFYSLHNETFKNERAIEIPIVMQYVKLYKNKKILEVGNVLSYYFQFEHTIIDKYEKGNSVLNYDIANYSSNEKYDLIVTISTLEHVGWDEYSRYGDNTTTKNTDPKLLVKAINNIKQMLNPKGTLIATMPMGFNYYLDSLIEIQETGFKELYFLKRISKDNEWKQVAYSEVKDAKYSDPYPCANSVVIGVFYLE